MRRRQRRIRRWLAVAVALVALSFASSAAAMTVAETGGGTAVYSQTPALTDEPSGGGFNWSDAAIGAGIAFGAAFSAGAVVRVSGGRRRLATLLH